MKMRNVKRTLSEIGFGLLAVAITAWITGHSVEGLQRAESLATAGSQSACSPRSHDRRGRHSQSPCRPAPGWESGRDDQPPRPSAR